MKVLWRGFKADSRLSVLNPRDMWEDDQNPSEPYLLIFHAPEGLEHVKQAIPRLLQDGKVRGVLFLKGTAYANVAHDVALALQTQYDNRIHFLSYAVGPNHNHYSTKTLFNRFLVQVSKLDGLQRKLIIPWTLVEPDPWPEPLVAILLGLVAIRHIPSLDASTRARILEALPWSLAHHVFTSHPRGLADEPVWSAGFVDCSDVEAKVRTLLEG